MHFIDQSVEHWLVRIQLYNLTFVEQTPSTLFMSLE